MIGFSIVIPIFNESKNLSIVIEEIFDSLKKYNEFELIIVNDGSNDDTNKVLDKIRKNYAIKTFHNKSNYGQSYSIRVGVKHSKYNIIVTMDGDGQNNPKDIINLLKIYNSNFFFSLVGGIRSKRKDSLIKITSSKIANNIRSLILKDNCVDTGCSLKVFDKKVFLSFPYFDGLHRFLPALFKGYGKKTFFVKVDHRPRISGISKYDILGRLFKGIFDIIRVIIIIRNRNLKTKDKSNEYK